MSELEIADQTTTTVIRNWTALKLHNLHIVNTSSSFELWGSYNGGISDTPMSEREMSELENNRTNNCD